MNQKQRLDAWDDFVRLLKDEVRAQVLEDAQKYADRLEVESLLKAMDVRYETTV